MPNNSRLIEVTGDYWVRFQTKYAKDKRCCYQCDIEIKYGDTIMSKMSGASKNHKFYHKDCWLRLFH